MKHYEYEINLLFDGELNKKEQVELYHHLSICDKCQEDFNKYNMLKAQTKSVYEKKLYEMFLPQENVSTDSTDIKRNNRIKYSNTFYRIGFYTSAAAAIVLMILLTTSSPKRVFITKNDSRVDTVFIQQEKNTPKITAAHSKAPGKRDVPVKSSQNEYLRYVMNLPVEKITDADLFEHINGSY